MASPLSVSRRPLTPEVGETWKRREGKERVRVGRVWQGYIVDEPETWCIRLHPRHGGKWWWTTVDEFVKRFDREGLA